LKKKETATHSAHRTALENGAKLKYVTALDGDYTKLDIRLTSMIHFWVDLVNVMSEYDFCCCGIAYGQCYICLVIRSPNFYMGF